VVINCLTTGRRERECVYVYMQITHKQDRELASIVQCPSARLGVRYLYDRVIDTSTLQ